MKLQQRKRATMVGVADEVKSRVIRFRVTEKFFKRIKKVAKLEKSTMSFLLEACLQKYNKKNWDFLD